MAYMMDCSPSEMAHDVLQEVWNYLDVMLIEHQNEFREVTGEICPKQCFCWKVQAVLSEAKAKQISRVDSSF